MRIVSLKPVGINDANIVALIALATESGLHLIRGTEVGR